MKYMKLWLNSYLFELNYLFVLIDYNLYIVYFKCDCPFYYDHNDDIDCCQTDFLNSTSSIAEMILLNIYDHLYSNELTWIGLAWTYTSFVLHQWLFIVLMILKRIPLILVINTLISTFYIHYLCSLIVKCPC